ncbi:MAG: serine hydrolase [Saprospiraceae bacterium]
MSPNHLSKIVFFLFFSISLSAQTNLRNLGIPYATFAKNYKPLEVCESTTLEAQLNQKLNQNPTWRKLIQQKKMSVALVDLSNSSNTRFAEVNGDKMMYAASLPKIAILLAAVDAIDKGELKETAAVKKDLQLMIAKSNNQASTRMIDRLGYDKIADVLTNPRYNLYDENNGGGLWVGKRYAAGGKKNPDPLQGLSHAATASQVAKFYYMMAHGKLVSPKRSEQMMQIMVNPKLHHKFVNTLEKIAPKAKLFRKSGSWSIYHSDSIMVWGPKRQYILVALVEDPKGEQIIRQIAKKVDSLVVKKKSL